ncbi:MAG TPA: class I SAM-dependent methyltransferase [Usitatibacter sp.]|nr:class I SAM-dependent methyltransferase [Usitatibacter sp.]
MAELFSDADAYERMMGRWSARLAPLFVRFAEVSDQAHVLDVGCGTGSLVLALTEEGYPASIVGIDPVEAFVKRATSRFGEDNITFEVGDATDLPYGDATFDVALALLVFMFIRDPKKAVAEMKRVTQPRGTVAACIWDREGVRMSSTFWEEAVKLDPAARERPGMAPGALGAKGQLESLWKEAGLENVEEVPLDISMGFRTFEDFWEPFLGGSGPSGAYLTSLPKPARDNLRQALRTRILAGKPNGPFALPARAWAVRGTVPGA